MLTISRDSGYLDYYEEYEIFMDDKYLAGIKRGEIKTFNIENGEHKIYIRTYWCRSNSLYFEYEKESLVNLKCGNSIKGIMCMIPFIELVTSIFSSRKYLWINKL